MHHRHQLHVLIVGCGLGGLACAIAACREGLKVTVLEQGDELAEVLISLALIKRVLTWKLGRRRHSNSSKRSSSYVSVRRYKQASERRTSVSSREQPVLSILRWRAHRDPARLRLGDQAIRIRLVVSIEPSPKD